MSKGLSAAGKYRASAGEFRSGAALSRHSGISENMMTIADDYEELASQLDAIHQIFSCAGSPKSISATYKLAMTAVKFDSLANRFRSRSRKALSTGSGAWFERHAPASQIRSIDRSASVSGSQSAITERANHAQLIAAVGQSRDRDCFRTLFLYYTPRVKSYLRGFGTPALVAEELAQETLLALWAKAATFNPNLSSPSTWVFTIARNIYIDRHRHASRRQTADGYFDETLPVVTPSEDWCAVQRTERLTEALSRLSTDQLTVVRLSFFEHKSHAQIAAELHIPLGTVKYRLRQVLNRLRIALHDVE